MVYRKSNVKNSDSYCYLVKVDPNSNTNIFREITINDDRSVDERYGRVGEDKVITRHYDNKNFYALVDFYKKQGFSDVTALHSEVESKKDSWADLQYEPIENKEIRELIDELILASREFMRKNYTITAKDITAKMLDEIQNDINTLSEIADNSLLCLYEFNKQLKVLYQDSLRKMDNVADYFIDEAIPPDVDKNEWFAQVETKCHQFIEREQLMLDNLQGIYESERVLEERDNKPEKKSGTVLEAYGLDISECTYKQEDEIISHLGRDYGGKSMERRFVKAFRVENERTRREYEQYIKEHHINPNYVNPRKEEGCTMFYHGSKVENWFSIMKQGLSLNPDAKVTGKMFGNGLYFASDARKSANYMDTKGSIWNSGKRETGYMALYDVALGKCYDATCALTRWDKRDVTKRGCMSVRALPINTGLENAEYIIYDQSQCTIRYLCEFRNNSARELTFNLERNAIRNNLSNGFDKMYKSNEGVIRMEIDLSKLPEAAIEEINDKILNNLDCDRLFVDYLSIEDKIVFMAQSYANGDYLRLSPVLTNDDYDFFKREVKKSFADRESDWKSIISNADKHKVGELCYSKCSVQAHQDNVKKINVEKE